ncbi:MAG: uracil phosphoribosyltransferase [Methylobacterium sp.]|nr:MAG: uracil phosphoribosyltransferase [Methylobacterium sp.]
MTSRTSEADALLSAAAVRTKARRLFERAKADHLTHFRLDLARLPGLAREVAAVTRRAYPTLDVPFHARWRHFTHAGRDRWAECDAATSWPSPAERARAAFDLVIVSVLLDAGAGAAWLYRDPLNGIAIGRSEGLALASFDMWAAGAFSDDPDNPLRADAGRLANLTVEALAEGFQAGPENPLEGLEGRARLINALGHAVLADPALRDAAGKARPGALFDVLAQGRTTLPASEILAAVLRHFGPIWPSRLTLEGVPLGDTWRHPLLDDGTPTGALVPFHKLSQWLSYSLIEPMQAAGITVTDIDGLTGLAEYRNGGLFLDGGVIVPKDAAILTADHAPDSSVIIEWRALTVALLDDIAPLVREALGVAEAAFPLARVLEGGTWATGRKLARERRADGSPPLRIVSDGTVF